MKIDIRPNLDQIRFFANAALHAYDFQSPEDARKNVQAEMLALLGYLDALDNGVGVAVARIAKIEDRIEIEIAPGSDEIVYLGHWYMKRNGVGRQASDLQRPGGVVVEDIGTQNQARTGEPERDFGLIADRVAKK